MAHTPVSWDPNRYGAVRYEYKLDSATGNYSLVEKAHNYSGVNYNFTPLVTTPPVTTPQLPVVPTPITPDPCPPGYKLVNGSCQATSGGGGGGGSGGGGGGITHDAYAEALGKRQYWDKQGEEWGPEPKSTTEGAWDVGKWGPGPKTELHDMDAYAKDPYGQRLDVHDMSAYDKKKNLTNRGSWPAGYNQGDPWIEAKADDAYTKTLTARKIPRYDTETMISGGGVLPFSDRGPLDDKDRLAKSLLSKRNASGLINENFIDFKKDPDIKTIKRSDYKLQEPKVSSFNIDEEHNKKMEIFNLTNQLKAGGLDHEEEAALRTRLDTLGSYDDKTGKYKLKHKKSILDVLPVIGTARKIGRAISEAFPASPVQKLNKRIFNVRGGVRDGGRITSSQYTDASGNVVTSSGNPATDLFAGMNRTSAFGNLEKSGQKRLDRRNKTIAKGKVSQKFIDATREMERQHSSYVQEKRKEINKHKATIGMPEMLKSGKEDQSGRDSGKIVCTMMNQRYGFGSFRNKIWLRFHKNYSPEYQKGYHKVFLPLVSIAKKEGIFNTIVRKILEHMGRHVTADMFQIMRNKKSDKLGRIYRKIFEPICYWLGGK